MKPGATMTTEGLPKQAKPFLFVPILALVVCQIYIDAQCPRCVCIYLEM